LPKEQNDIVIIPIFDAHIGAKSCNLNLLKKTLDKVRNNDNYYFLLGGDMLDMALKDSIAGSYGSNPAKDIKKFLTMFDGLWEKCLFAITGNHEYRLSRNAGIDIYEYILPNTQKIYAGDSGVLKVSFGTRGKTRQYTATFYVYHGAGGGRTIGSKANWSKRGKEVVEGADVYLSGHTHVMMYDKEKIVTVDTHNKGFGEKEQHFVVCGSYLDYEGYAERKVLAPSVLGSPEIRLTGNGNKTEIKVMM